MLLTSFSIELVGQNRAFGGLPSVNFNLTGQSNWSFNGKIESRQQFHSRASNNEHERGIDYLLTDFSLLAARKLGLSSRLAVGYLFRLEEGNLQHRFMQQMVVVQRLRTLRLAHRFLSDQTFSSQENTEIRFRYRITMEVPLNGESLDPGEFYVKANQEILYGMAIGAHDLELRFIPLLGYNFVQDLKMEAGIDYRLGSIIGGNNEQKIWLAVNLFFDFG